MLKAVLSGKDLSKCEDYFNCVSDLLQDKNVRRLNEYGHHILTTRFQHSLNVSYYNFLLCRFLHLDSRSAARAGMLHDLFFYDRKTHVRIQNSHAAEHANIAFYNASQYFPINELEGDMIVNHMWPMTAHLPRHRETFVITLVDKFCACAEVVTAACHITNAKMHLAAGLAIMFLMKLNH